MELDLAVLADVVSIRPDGKLDLHGVGWDTIFASAVPALHPRMDIGLRFLLSAQEAEHEHQVVITLITADGQEMAKLNTTTQPVPPEQRAAIPAGRRLGVVIVTNLSNLIFPAYGDYSFVITWDGNEPRTPLSLHIAPLSFPGPPFASPQPPSGFQD